MNGHQTGNGQQTGNGGDQTSSYFFYQSPEYPRDCEEVKDQCSSSTSSGVYLIKPDGYPKPFEVYCDSRNSESWTVIYRRIDGSIDFNREWDGYVVGFGFLSQEFWIGNEKLSYLTNQNKYQLLVDITNIDGSLCYITYNLFRIGDEYSSYKLSSVGVFSGNTSECIHLCSDKKEPGDCTCQRTCQDPYGCHNTCNEDETCVCSEGLYLKGEDCVPQKECECYDSTEGVLVTHGEFYVSPTCTTRVDCKNGQLSWDDSYTCSPNATCEERGNVRQCYCNTGHIGNGVICTLLGSHADCQEIYDSGVEDSGIYTISPSSWPGSPFTVYCNMTDGGGWTTFQRRVDGTVDFYRNWASYKEGFGFPDHEFWLGNEKLYYLTNQKRYTIRIDLINEFGSPYYAKFDFFRITGETDKYRLSELGSYSGTADFLGSSDPNAGHALTWHRNYQFSTHDQDNDVSNCNCAAYHHGAWWYRNCHRSNLNGDYNSTICTYYSCSSPGIRWNYLPGNECSIKFTEMKIRPSQ
ncbi:Ficolin-1 [Holothuria leucospilota]|uniref:Ficolin-1 n=1 Tax=Holothuria leucospilota TaxID=206669 RepID=A0A9Q1BUM4_HOLLE|nr:Ficolin-1 [Holothuria leucospilota]